MGLETEYAALRKEAYENDKELNEKLKKEKQKVSASKASIAALNMDSNILATALEEVILQKNENAESLEMEKVNEINDLAQIKQSKQFPTLCSNAMGLFWIFYTVFIALWTFEMDTNENIFYEEKREKVFDKRSSAELKPSTFSKSRGFGILYYKLCHHSIYGIL